MNNVSENKICQNCQKDFKIESEDFNFYEKIKVPTPTWCPECRMIRRFLIRDSNKEIRLSFGIELACVTKLIIPTQENAKQSLKLLTLLKDRRLFIARSAISRRCIENTPLLDGRPKVVCRIKLLNK